MSWYRFRFLSSNTTHEHKNAAILQGLSNPGARESSPGWACVLRGNLPCISSTQWKENTVSVDCPLRFPPVPFYLHLPERKVPSLLQCQHEARDTGHPHFEGQFVGITQAWKLAQGQAQGRTRACRCPAWRKLSTHVNLLVWCKMSPSSLHNHITWQRVTDGQRRLNLHDYRQKHLSPLLHHCIVLQLH